jgi:hypothetical protein
MDRMDVGAAIEQQRNHPACRMQDRPMQRRASGRVSSVHKCCVGIQKFADALDIVGLRSQMDRMIGPHLGRRNSSPAAASLVEKLRDDAMTPVPGHFDETAVVIGVPLRIRARFKQDLHGLEMPFSYSEMDHRCVEILRVGQAGVASDQAPKRGCVAGCGGSDHIPGIAPAVSFQFTRFDHSDLLPVSADCFTTCVSILEYSSLGRKRELMIAAQQ